MMFVYIDSSVFLLSFYTHGYKTLPENSFMEASLVNVSAFNKLRETLKRLLSLCD